MNEISKIDKQIETSKYIAESAMSPHKRHQDVLFALMVGEAVGLPPAVAVLNIININGRPCISADVKLALVKNHPQYAGCTINSSATDCTVTLRRKREDGGFDEVVSTFGQIDADRANLSKKDNYRYYPARMYKARAVSYACNDLFPDAVWGVASVEEAVDIVPANDIESTMADIRSLISERIQDTDEADHFTQLANSAYEAGEVDEIRLLLKKLKAKKDPKTIKTTIKTTAEIVDIEPVKIDNLAAKKIEMQKAIETANHPDREAIIAKIWAAKSEADLEAINEAV